MKSSSSTKDSTPASGNRRGSGMTTSANSGNPCYIVMCPARPKAVSRATVWAGPSQAIGDGPATALAWLRGAESQSHRLRPQL